MNIDQETISRLIKEAVDSIGFMDVYTLSFPYVDMEAMKAAEGLTQEEHAAAFAVAGFAAGIEFALKNLEITDE